MTMHLAHPSLSLIGKKKTKRKYRTSEQAQTARKLRDEWKELEEKWNKMARTAANKPLTKKSSTYSLKVPIGRETEKIPSVDTWTTGALPSSKNQQYTGTNMIGIGTLHKSNAVPIFSEQEAKDISTMRRG